MDDMKIPTCGDCIHADVCARVPYLTEFSCDNPAYCKDFNNKADYAEVVRCKDCIHWYETEGVCLKIYSDGEVSPYAWQDRNPDDFCSYGERRTDV